MTISDYAVLAFLAGTFLLNPATTRSTFLLLGLMGATGMVALMIGNVELLLATSAVVASLALACLSVFISWRDYAVTAFKTKFLVEGELTPA